MNKRGVIKVSVLVGSKNIGLPGRDKSLEQLHNKQRELSEKFGVDIMYIIIYILLR